MHRECISDELRRLEGEVVEVERQLAELEKELVALKQTKQDVSEIEAALALLRDCQHRLQQDRARLLSLLQP
jgi:predicted  nucleic acid-binding Zn-ribbon protein